jgi:hypothetical protein
MKCSRFLFIIILFAIFLLGLFSLPAFSINIGDQTLRWSGIDFKSISSASPWGNFRKGSGLYPSQQIRFKADYSVEQEEFKAETFAEDVGLMRRRIEAAGLYDVDLTSEKSNGEHEVVFTFPEYYSVVDIERVAQLLVQPGNIEIWEHDVDADPTSTPHEFLNQYYPGYIPRLAATIDVKDIATIAVETRAVLNGSVWRVKFSDEVKAALAQAMLVAGYATQTPKPFIIAIDGSPVMVLLSIGSETDMLGRSFDILTDQTELKVMSTYLLGGVGIRTAYQIGAVTELNSAYGTEGKSVTSITIILSAILIGLFVLRRFGRRKFVAFVLALSAYVLLSISVLKLLAVTLSIGFLIGFLLMYALGVLVIFNLIRMHETAVKRALVKYRQLGSLMLFVAGLIYVSGTVYGNYQDMLGVVAMMGITLFISCLIFFPQLIAYIYYQPGE